MRGPSVSGHRVATANSPQVVQNVVTYDVAAPNADLALLPGLTANNRIVTDHRDAALRHRPRLPQPGGFASLT